MLRNFYAQVFAGGRKIDVSLQVLQPIILVIMTSIVLWEGMMVSFLSLNVGCSLWEPAQYSCKKRVCLVVVWYLSLVSVLEYADALLRLAEMHALALIDKWTMLK